MKNKLLRILAAATALLLIVIVIWFADSLVGNPITKTLATRDIKTYLSTKYPNTDYTLDHVSFNFKFHEYNGSIVSPSSKDSSFTITWRNGTVIDDTFDYSVVGRENTTLRYEREARAQIIALLQTVPDLSIGQIHVCLGKTFYESDAMKSLVLDSPYDKSIHIPLELSIDYDGDTASLEEYAPILEKVHNVLSSHGYMIDFYSIHNYDQKDATFTLCADEVTPEDIESGQLLTLLNKAFENESSGDASTLSVTYFER